MSNEFIKHKTLPNNYKSEKKKFNVDIHDELKFLTSQILVCQKILLRPSLYKIILDWENCVWQSKINRIMQMEISNDNLYGMILAHFLLIVNCDVSMITLNWKDLTSFLYLFASRLWSLVLCT